MHKHTSRTIDEKHTEMLNDFFNNDTVVIPEIERDIIELKRKSKLVSTSNDIEEYMDILDQIEKIKKELNILRSQKKKYLLENSKYIFNYFEYKKGVVARKLAQKEITITRGFKI